MGLRRKIEGFDVQAYRYRLGLLREALSGESQVEFAKSLGIAFKRWSNYERGYPIPREVAFILMNKYKGTSVEWVWFGTPNNLSKEVLKKIEAAEERRKRKDALQKDLNEATRKLAEVKAKLDKERPRRV